MARILIILTFLGSGYAAFACPLGAKEERLSFQRVMRNFGRFIMPAEMIAYRGQNKYEKITDSQLQEAIEKLSLVLSCANAVLENPMDELLPVASRSLTEPAKADYIDSYLFFMDEFKASVAEYQAVYIKLLAQPETERNFAPLLSMTKRQNALIDWAHKRL